MAVKRTESARDIIMHQNFQSFGTPWWISGEGLHVLECLRDNSGLDESIASLLAIIGDKQWRDQVPLYVQETSMRLRQRRVRKRAALLISQQVGVNHDAGMYFEFSLLGVQNPRPRDQVLLCTIAQPSYTSVWKSINEKEYRRTDPTHGCP